MVGVDPAAEGGVGGAGGADVGVAAAGFGSQALAATTTLVSITPQKIVGNALSRNVSLSKSGAQCAFESDATNLTLQDGNVDRDIFM